MQAGRAFVKLGLPRHAGVAILGTGGRRVGFIDVHLRFVVKTVFFGI